MRILVTGADGFLGAATVARLRSAGRTVVGCSRRSPSRDGYAHCDLEDPIQIARLFELTSPTHVVSLAARVDFSANVLPALYPVNVLCPAILAFHCRRNGSRLIHASSIQVQGSADVRAPMDVAPRPGTDYGVSKWLAELAITAAGCSAAIIRFAGIFGSDGPEHLGVNRAIQAARRGVAPTLVGSGAALRNYIYVHDAAAMIDAAVMGSFTGLFFAGGETQSIKDMLQGICDVWLPGHSVASDDGDGSPDQLVAVSSELGPFRRFRDCLRHMR